MGVLLTSISAAVMPFIRVLSLFCALCAVILVCSVLNCLSFAVSGEFLDCEGSGLYSLQSSCKLIVSALCCFNAI